MVKDTFNLVYSTRGWQGKHAKSWKRHLASLSKKEREQYIRTQDGIPLCCDLTKTYFRNMLAREAQRKGFKVVRWPIRNREAWMKVGEAARSGKMRGSAAVLCHAWSDDTYEKECIPGWEFYPVLNEVMAKCDLVYPHPELDQLHSEKRYTSPLMAPTRYLNFVRRPEGWKVRGNNKDVKRIVAEELKKLKVRTLAKGLAFKDVMVKQGLSWGGEAVVRLPINGVQDYMLNTVLPNLASMPPACKELCILFQSKIDIVSELRWGMVNGELRGNEWKSLNEPVLGYTAESAGYQDQHKAKRLVERFVNKLGKFTMEELETRMGMMCKKVYAEATADAGGEPPLYMRIDLLLDKQGRVWLGERESWGADINGNDEFKRMDPTYKELAQKMISKTRQKLSKGSKGKHAPSSRRGKLASKLMASSRKRKVASLTSASVSAKRARSTV